MDSSNNMNNSNGSKSNQFDHDSANDCDENALEPAAKDLEEAVTAYLRRATETFDLSKNVEVSNYLIWSTYFNFHPSLRYLILGFLTIFWHTVQKTIAKWAIQKG